MPTDGARSRRCDQPLRFNVSSLPPVFLIEYEVTQRGQCPPWNTAGDEGLVPCLAFCIVNFWCTSSAAIQLSARKPHRRWSLDLLFLSLPTPLSAALTLLISLFGLRIKDVIRQLQPVYGRFVGILDWDPSVSKSNRLQLTSFSFSLLMWGVISPFR